MTTGVSFGPPGQGGASSGEPPGFSDDAELVVTYVPDGHGVGRRIPVRATGFAIGGPDDHVQVESATATGTRLTLECSPTSTAETASKWIAHGTGRIRIAGEITTARELGTGDELQVVDTFFRFLCGPDLEHQYHETIYHLTIRDTPTGLPNERYVNEILRRELVRVEQHGTRLVVAAIVLEPFATEPGASHDAIREIARRARAQVADRRVLGRTSDSELLLVWPDATVADVEPAIRRCLEAGHGEVSPPRLGLAEARRGATSIELIAEARANANLTAPGTMAR